ncbi:MAG TPA: AI-2E family transporter [Micromonosporaceae bacterium]|nr:AI-2E family transporter [Micromonosporaceae bacterium]HCU51150.1 AI-2E family transporter [Micromonosporaceae bacterium]
MGTASNGTVFRRAVAATCGAVAVLLAILALWTVRDILVLALVAMFIAVSLDPAVRWLVRHGVKRPYAVTLMILLALTIVGIVMALIIPPLVNEVSQISRDLPGYVSDLDRRSETFRELSTRYGLDQHLNNVAKDLPARISNSAIGFFRRFLGVLASTLLVLVLAIYFMADLPRIRRLIPRIAPVGMRERTRRIVDVVVDKVGSYMIGGLAVSFIASSVTYISLAVLKVPFALPLALLVFITAFIPLIGASLGAIICVLVAAITKGVWPTATIVLIIFIIYQQLENYIIAPRVFQKTVNLPAVGVLLAGLIGGTLLGLVGALMAIPIAAAIKAVLVEVHGTTENPVPGKEPPLSGTEPEPQPAA